MSRPEAAVADAGPLIHLDELSRLNVLDVYSKVWVPGVVARETDHHRPGWQDRAPDNIERVEVAPDNVNALRAAHRPDRIRCIRSEEKPAEIEEARTIPDARGLAPGSFIRAALNRGACPVLPR